jgi:hypothetical protein
MLGLHRQYAWVAWNRGYTQREWLDRTYSQLDRWSLRGALRVVASCSPLAKQLESTGVQSGGIEVIYNFVKPFIPRDDTLVECTRHQLGIRGKTIILAVGRLAN